VKLKGLTHLAVSSACLHSEPVTFSLHVPATTLRNEKQNIKQSVATWARRGSEGTLLVGAASYGGVLTNLIEQPLSLMNTTSNMLVDPETIPMFASLFVVMLFMLLARMVWNKLDPAQFAREPAVFTKFKRAIAAMLGVNKNQVKFKTSKQGNMETLEIMYTPKKLSGGMMQAWKQELTLSGGMQERRNFNYVLGQLKGGLDPPPPRPPIFAREEADDGWLHRGNIDREAMMQRRREQAERITEPRRARLNRQPTRRP
tara:strand:+ start:7009 stop:7782 length:774 start_codon:yes stop_codon:yes gene_type:complete